MGQAHIRLDHVNARTAIPGLEALHFTLDFTGPGKEPVPKTLNNGLTTLTVALESGEWTLEVKGYSSENRLTVRGTSSITITAGISSPVTVYLIPDFSEGGTGTLSYNVEFPGTVSRAFLGLYPLNAPGPKQSSGDTPETSREMLISGSPTGTLVDLPAGTYQALIDLYAKGDDKAAVWTGVVHIYDGSTTALTPSFTLAHFAACPPPPVIEASANTLAAKLDAALASPPGSYTIVLDGTEEDLFPKFFVPNPQPLSAQDGKAIAITIRGNGYTVQVTETGTPLFTLGPGLTLAIQDLRLQGMSNNSVPVVQVENQGTLEMKAGSRITGNLSSSNGGGVYVDGGTFTMSGGAVSGNSASQGGGVFAYGGTFSMSGGVVSDNSNSSSGGLGGGVYAYGGTFTMSGGMVSGNKSTAYGGGVFAGHSATFNMSGGTISGNSVSGSKEGGGVHLNTATFTMSGGVISGNDAGTGGGGVYVSLGATFNMSGGEVRNNTASKGGGVYLKGTIFSMTRGVIYGSTAGAGLANTATTSGAAFFKQSGTINLNGLAAKDVMDETIDKRTP
jgi:hypothetical protein